MRKKIVEGSVLFISILKWLFLAACIGIIVGISTTVFLKVLGFGISTTARYQYYYLLLPAALFVSALIVKVFAPDAEGHGTEKIIEAVHRHAGKMNLAVVPVKLVATVITIAFGGSAGKEGPAAQIGAALSSGFSRLLRFGDRDRKKMVICGISAGFATVFGTPIAGALFGVEVLFVGAVLYDVLLPSFVAGIVGYQVSTTLGLTYFHGPHCMLPAFSSFFFLKVCLAGLFFGLCSLILIEMLGLFHRLSRGLKIWMPYKGIIGGGVLVALSFLFSTHYLGLGLDTIKNVLEGREAPAGAFVLKMLFTAITLGFGGSGGIVTPIFFVGSTAGSVFGRVLGFDTSVFSAIGMVALLAGAANTPISASIMAIELFGPEVAPYAAVACIISYLMTGHRSVYPSQVLSQAKSSSLNVATGSEMRDAGDVQFHVRSKTVSSSIMAGIDRFRKQKH
ncbi:MAG TPA: chloride channel protein [Nitrospirota bacterium]|nr:chloride channel protein [Nitrospirota bacterium]